MLSYLLNVNECREEKEESCEENVILEFKIESWKYNVKLVMRWKSEYRTPKVSFSFIIFNTKIFHCFQCFSPKKKVDAFECLFNAFDCRTLTVCTYKFLLSEFYRERVFHIFPIRVVSGDICIYVSCVWWKEIRKWMWNIVE
jgi:hypothetical protein